MKSPDSDPRPDPARVEEVFHAASELAAGEQAAFLSEACNGDRDLESVVRALLDTGQHSSTAWDGTALDLEARESARAARRVQPGEVVGPYRIVRRIAAGGMSVVYEAMRDDAEYHMRVAIKFVQQGIDDAAAGRFRSERQILAELEHPNVARLLDGGTTEDGTPYLVMEYVDGVPIDRFAIERRLSRGERLHLFLQVCNAVQYAHRNLVVHRDLKPGNILVTADGVPKLLDFGIAKLLSDDPRARTTIHALTPEYASPEQVLGHAVTTATDVYSLGVLLFVLLAERSPYRANATQPADLVRAICEEEPVWHPARLVQGDLQSIVAQALRKEPERRYLSVEQFATDIRHYIGGLPVSAKPASFTYLIARLARRHRAAFTAAAVSFVALLIALGVSIWQTRVAVAARNRANERFADVRQLSTALIFKIHDGVAPLPGSTPVRQMIVAEALTYLERLSRDPGSDDGLRLELARGYHRVADVQGKPSVANLGDRKGALASYQKGLTLARQLRSGRLARDAAFEVAQIDMSIAMVLSSDRAGSDSHPSLMEAIETADKLVRLNASDDAARRLLGSAYFQMAAQADHAQALGWWNKAGAVFEALLTERPDDPDRQRNVALIEKYLGSHYEMEADHAAALPHHQRALGLDEERLASMPQARAAQIDVAVDLSNVGYNEHRMGHSAAAVAPFERCLKMREELVSSDPQDVRGRAQLALIHSRFAEVLEVVGRLPEALDHVHAAVEIDQALAQIDSTGKRSLAQALQTLGDVEGKAGHRTASCEAYRRSLESMTSLQRMPALSAGLQLWLTDQIPGLQRAVAACRSVRTN